MVSASLYSCPKLLLLTTRWLFTLAIVHATSTRAPSYVIASIVCLFIVPMHMIVGSCTSSWQLAFTPIYTLVHSTTLFLLPHLWIQVWGHPPSFRQIQAHQQRRQDTLTREWSWTEGRELISNFCNLNEFYCFLCLQHKESAMAKIKQKKSVGSRKSKAHHRQHRLYAWK